MTCFLSAMTMISFEMLSRETLPLEGIYQRAREEMLTPPQSSPESQHRRNTGNNIIADNTTCHDMHPLDQPAVDLGLPPHIPEILYCK